MTSDCAPPSKPSHSGCLDAAPFNDVQNGCVPSRRAHPMRVRAPSFRTQPRTKDELPAELRRVARALEERKHPVSRDGVAEGAREGARGRDVVPALGLVACVSGAQGHAEGAMQDEGGVCVDRDICSRQFYEE